MFKILKTVRTATQYFVPGQEAQLVAHAEAHPDQLDFIRLLDKGMIDDIPETQTLTPAEREQKAKKEEEDRLKKIEAANAEAARAEEEAQELIRMAREQAEKRDRESLKAQQDEVERNAGLPAADDQ